MKSSDDFFEIKKSLYPKMSKKFSLKKPETKSINPSKKTGYINKDIY